MERFSKWPIHRGLANGLHANRTCSEAKPLGGSSRTTVLSCAGRLNVLSSRHALGLLRHLCGARRPVAMARPSAPEETARATAAERIRAHGSVRIHDCLPVADGSHRSVAGLGSRFEAARFGMGLYFQRRYPPPSGDRGGDVRRHPVAQPAEARQNEAPGTGLDAPLGGTHSSAVG